MVFGYWRLVLVGEILGHLVTQHFGQLPVRLQPLEGPFDIRNDFGLPLSIPASDPRLACDGKKDLRRYTHGLLVGVVL